MLTLAASPLCLGSASRRHNYFGTQSLMELSSQMDNLRSFVHVSTYFVNNHMPRNSEVKEQLHPVPLELHGQPVAYKAFVEGLMAMSTEEANKTALDLMAKNNFNSSYAFGAYAHTAGCTQAAKHNIARGQQLARPGSSMSAARLPTGHMHDCTAQAASLQSKHSIAVRCAGLPCG